MHPNFGLSKIFLSLAGALFAGMVTAGAAYAQGGPPPGGPPGLDQLIIVSVETAFTEDTTTDPPTPIIQITVNGESFQTADELVDVSLGGVAFTLDPAFDTITPTQLVFEVDDAAFPAKDYLMTVSRGPAPSEADAYDLTIGAVGPVGLEGLPGPAGATGATGPEGPAGFASVQIVKKSLNYRIRESPGGNATVGVSCPTGTVLVGGAATSTNTLMNIYVNQPNGNGWSAGAAMFLLGFEGNEQPFPVTGSVTAIAFCANTS